MGSGRRWTGTGSTSRGGACPTRRSPHKERAPGRAPLATVESYLRGPAARSPEGRANGRTLPHSPGGGQNTPMRRYRLLKFLPGLVGITAVGRKLTHPAWNGRGARGPQPLALAPPGIQFLDNRVANP